MQRSGVRPIARWMLAGVLVLGLVACGGRGSSQPTAPSPAPTPPPAGNTITITTSGVTPRELTIAVGSRVTVTNSDTRAHDFSSDPHPEHTDCPEINQVGFINPGQTKETGNFVTAKTCGFHDHNQPSNDSLRGRIVVR